MSLYNQVVGFNPIHMLLNSIIEMREKPPRYRDAYLNDADEIVVLTRTGGGNRVDFEDENNRMRANPLYLRDHDDAFDETFAHWVYSVPPRFVQAIPVLRERQGGSYDPLARFRAAINSAMADEDTPEAVRAIQVGKEMLERMIPELKAGLRSVLDEDHPANKE